MTRLLLFAALALGFDFGSRALRGFERDAALEIATKLEGPDKRVSVRTRPTLFPPGAGRVTITGERFATEGLPLLTEPNRDRRGRIDRLDIRLRDFTLRGLRIDSLNASIPNCRFDLMLALKERKFRLSQSGVGRGEVRVLEKDLEVWILRKYREIKRVSVKLDRGVAWVEGYGEFLLVKTKFEVIADVAPVEGTKLLLTNARIYFDWLRADPFASKALLDVLNPVVDLDRDLNLMDAIKVDKILIKDGVLTAWGDTQIPTARARTYLTNELGLEVASAKRDKFSSSWLGTKR